MIGTKLAHYEITSHIGSGGMGDVYQATDTKLGREVAIKTLPAEFTSDPDRLARFQREAKLLASLNHPNIGTIYGLEEFNGAPFLILELVEGETLADRLKHGAIPVEESLKIAVEIADALEEAHEKGVIHRDLKPGNIKVTPERKVKVLDFGLAKALAGNETSAALSNSPTLSNAATLQGVILGTAAYMSPEQAKGRATTRQADIWAFGCVLYEMLTGLPVFEGADVSEILASVIKGTTNLDLLPANLHPAVRRVIQRCLEKDLKKRFRDIGDVRYELAEILADASGALVDPRMQSLRSDSKWKRSWIAASLIGLVVAGLAGWTLKRVSPPFAGQVHRFYYDLPEGQVFRDNAKRLVAVSRDGSRFVYNATNGLYLRSMDSPEAKLIPGTDQVSVQPFFSPDGDWIAFFSGTDHQLKKIPLNGGAAVLLCSSYAPSGASWSTDNTIVYGQPDGIWRVSSGGGKPDRIVEIEQGEEVDSPQLLAGGDWILFTSTKATGPNRWEEADIVAASLKSRQRKLVWRGGSDAQYVPTGHLVYAFEDTLYAVPFDPVNLEPKGGQFPILQGLRSTTSSQSHYAFSDEGTLIYVPGGASNRAGQRVLALVDRGGVVQRLGLPPKAYISPRLSPDEKRIVVETEERLGNIVWVYDLSGSTDIRQLTLKGNNQRPIWTPDSSRVTFASGQDGQWSIYIQPADGSGTPERLTTAEKGTESWPDSWSPDGKTLSFVVTRGNDSGVWTLSADTHTAKVFADEPGSIQRGSMFSPDGRWIVYHSDESSGFDVYARPFPAGPKKRITDGRRTNPIWPLRGSELFYSLGGTGQIFARTISLKDGLTFGREQMMPLPRYVGFGSGYRSWDVSSDGKRFLMVLPAAEQTVESRLRINIVLNWFRELQERVPVK